MAKDGYKGHRVGSNKEAVHKRFDEKGADSAVKLAIARGIKEATVKTWCSAWKNGTGKKKVAKASTAKKTVKKAAAPAKKPVTKKTAKKAAPKKAAKPAAKKTPRVRPEFGPDAEKVHASA